MMKKQLLVLIFSGIILSAVLAGCSGTVETEKVHNIDSENLKSMFVEVEKSGIWKIVYDKKNKVMYAVSNGAYNQGIFTLLVNESGNPRLWDGEQ